MEAGTSEKKGNVHSRLRPNPEQRANFLSQITLFFLTPFLRLGWKKTLEVEDIFQPMDEHESQTATSRLMRAWMEEKKTAEAEERTPSLRKTITRTYGWSIARLGILLAIEEAFHLAQPIFMGRLIRYFKLDNGGLTSDDAYLAAAGVAISALLATVIHHPYFYGLQKIGMEIKCAVSGIIVDKGIRLSSSALHKTTVGHLVNVLSTDVSKFDMGFIFIHYMWVSPLILISYAYVIWEVLGAASFAGFGVIVVLIPFQAFLGKLMGSCRRVIASRADKRISVMSEILAGIKVIKMYSWEEAFSALVDQLRGLEMKSVKRYAYVQSTMLGLFWATGKLVVLAAALCYVFLGHPLTADAIFVAAALFNSCRLPITLFLPFAFHCLFDMMVSIDRIQKVLLLEEFNDGGSKAIEGRKPYDITLQFKAIDAEEHLLSGREAEAKEEVKAVEEPSEGPLVLLEDFAATWGTEEEEGNEEGEGPRPVVEGMNLRATSGQLIAVVGAVGAGKSSLLLSLLHETRRLHGRLLVRGSVAFCSQDACIFSATLKENVLFGSAFDETRYKRALELSALAADLTALPAGDATLVGDRGASLSGGQKARLALARAVYRDADIYILDDPLSAVDATVGRFLYDECICRGLRSKIVILATHQIHFVHSADQVIVMKGGKVIAQGTPDVLEQAGEIIQEGRRVSGRRISRTSRQSGGDRSDAGGEEEDVEEEVEEAILDDLIDDETVKKEEKKEQNGQIEEESAEGAVPWSVYWTYVCAMCKVRPLLVGPIFFSVIFTQIMFVVVDWWLNKWCDASERAMAANVSISAWRENLSLPLVGLSFPVSDDHFKTLYITMTSVLVVIAVVRCIWFRMLEVDASRYLHKRMFDAIIHAPLAFFDSNPIGRILNRFSKDVSTMDDVISMVFFEFCVGMLNLASLVGMVFFLNPIVVLPSLPIIVVFYFLRECYLSTSRDIKRIEATSRSPLFSHISALMASLVTIRAFGNQDTVMTAYHDMQNVNTAAFYAGIAASRWFAVWIDWLVAAFISVVAFFCIFSPDLLSSGQVALMLVYAVQLTGFFSWLMRQSAELQNGMVSVERIVNYMGVESEGGSGATRQKERGKGSKQMELPLSPLLPTPKDSDDSAPLNWPAHGHIQMNNLWMRYGEHSEYVLKGVTLDIRAGEKIGIVGRTGAGKSSLLRALFRLTLPARGEIIIDDVDTATVPLPTLRRSIGIIPQEPVLFVGSIRRNLDPFDEYSDDALWRVLEQVELRSAVSAMGGLEAAVHEGGANLSVGQRQLLCLARALLRKTSILVIDEATANVDNKTDALIQRTLRSSFSHATVLTIAHRLHTIMDSSRVLVLELGEVRELDHAHVLLSSAESAFSHLVAETGSSSEALLRQMAASAWDASQGGGAPSSPSSPSPPSPPPSSHPNGIPPLSLNLPDE